MVRGNLRAKWIGLAVVAAAVLCLTPGALAVHGTGLFELDGDAFNDTAVNGDDWSTVNAGIGGFFSRVLVGSAVEAPGTDATYFSNASKDINDVSTWSANGTSAPDKDEITNAYAAAYANPADGHTLLYFGADRYATNGDANIGFWFFRNSVSVNSDGTFSGIHSNGDLFVVSAFTNGGSTPNIEVYEWQNGALTPVTNGSGCAAGDVACARVNTSPIPVTWSYTPKNGTPGVVPAGGFIEGGVDLSALYGGDVPCFSSFLAETRSSQEPNATLKDLALGKVDSCGSITIRKDAKPDSSQEFRFTAGGPDAKVADFTLVDNGDTTAATKLFESIKAGAYRVSENDPGSAWELASIACTTSGTGTTATTGGSTADITLAAGGNVDCTYTNVRKPTLTVTKTVVPASDPGSFALQIDGQTKATGGNGTTTGAVVVSAGAHTVAELGATGTNLADYGTVYGGDCDASGNVTLAAGDAKTCTITNTRKPTLTVTKVLVPAGDGGSFGLQIDGQTKATGGNAASTGAVAVSVGAHTVGEVGVSGTDLARYETSIAGDCDAGGNVSLAAGENKTCVITNRRKPTLTVTKVLAPADDPGTFGLQIDGDTKATGGNGTTTGAVEVSIGGHTVGEVGAAGTDASKYVSEIGGDCLANGSVTLAAGEHKSCTITNTRKARLIVIKKVVNDDGGTAVPADFTMSVTGSSAAPASFAGADTPGVEVSLEPGSYSVSESGPSGYKGTLSTGCSGSIAHGQTKTCTVTNDDIAPKLVVIKKVVNDDGGSAVPADFTLAVAGQSPAPASFAGSSQGVSVELKPGAYSVSESGGSAGYAASFSDDCSGSIALGETKTCTVTNDDSPAKLIVIKKVVNDDGGNAAPGDFTLSVTGTSPNPASFKGDAQGVTVGLQPGAYSVGESGPAGYAGTFSTECSGSIALGETKTCTVTNDDKPAKLIVIKKVVNDDGGAAVPADFTLAVSGEGASPASFAGDAQGVAVSLRPGAYSVSETGGPAGYAGSFSTDCSGSIALGETKTCTVTNDDKPAKLIVVKKVVNDDGGSATAGDFTLAAAGSRVSPASFKGNAQGVTVSLQPGQYSVSETGGPAGYAGSFSTDCSGSIALGETKTCTVTNDDKPAKLIVVKKVVNDDGGRAVPSDFTLSVTGTSPNPASFKGDAQGVTVGIRPGAYSVSESGPAGYAGSFSADCSGSIALGETKTCTVTNNDVAQPAPPPPPPPPAVAVTPPPAPQIDLAITKTDRPDPATVGDRLTYTETVRNNGPDTATGVVVADPLPAGVSFVSVRSTRGTCTGGAVIECRIGTLKPGESATITIVVRPRSAGVVINTATVVGNEAETNTANNTATATTLVRGPFVPPVPRGCIGVSVATRSTIVGQRTQLVLRLAELGKPAKGVRVHVKGAGVDRLSPRSNSRGVIRMSIVPRKAGIIRIGVSAQKSCGTPRIGVIGAFTPPVTG